MPPQTTKEAREACLKEAIQAVESDYFNTHSEVARAFDIPLSTLRLRLAKGANTPKIGGHNKKLSNTQEKLICE